VPFTISHAAAVLPLQRITRSRIPLAAMMIGSMAPDFAFFVPLDLVSRDFTHDFEGVLLFCWPVGLLLWLLFVKVLERPTIEILPSPWRERVPRSLAVTPRALLLASIGVVVGAITHIALDAFTHGGTPVGNLFPLLNSEAFEFRGRVIHVFGVLQVLTSIVGLLALAYWFYNLRHAPPPKRRARDRFGFLSARARILAALMVIGTSGVVALVSFVDAAGEPIEGRLFRLLINGMVAGALAWLAVAVTINRVAQRAPANPPRR
jgi:membrane-bound metal-dependent hydrolase YbcI (DUF457 family)